MYLSVACICRIIKCTDLYRPPCLMAKVNWKCLRTAGVPCNCYRPVACLHGQSEGERQGVRQATGEKRETLAGVCRNACVYMVSFYTK